MLIFSMALGGLFSVKHIGDLYSNEDNAYTLEISSAVSGNPVPNATIAIYKGDKVVGRGTSNKIGIVSFILHPLEEGQVAFSITKEGYNEYVLFQDIVARPVEPTATPIPTPSVTPTPKHLKSTGFVLLNPSDRGLFLFVMLFAFISLFSSSALFYKNYVMEQSDDGAWDFVESFTNWLKRE